MQLNGLRPVWRRKFVHTTDSKNGLTVSPNVLNRQFKQALPNQVWVADITYIRMRSGWLYLEAVLDLHSRKIVGWAMNPAMPAGLVVSMSRKGTNTKRYGVESVKHHLGAFTIDTLSHKVISAFLKKLQVKPIPQPANKTKTHPLYDGDRARCYTPGSARKLFYALKTATEWHSHERHYPLGDKFQAVEVPAAWAAQRDRRLNGDEETRLLVACVGMYKDPRGWQLLIGLALETAMRAAELTGRVG